MTIVPVRFAPKCFEAKNVLIEKCDCCGKIKVYLIDGQHRIQAVGEMSDDRFFELANNVAEACGMPADEDDAEVETTTIN